MIRGLEGVLASRKAFIDATASRDAVAAGHADSASNAAAGPAKPAMQQLVERPTHGFVGLFNQGATCYLNSFVSSLYMLPDFREAIFRFKLPAGLSKTSSVAAQLQALFFRLRAGANGATGTGSLTRSFGWGVEEVFQQQDVQELFQKVFEALFASVAAAKEKADSGSSSAADGDSAPNDNAALVAALQGFSGLQHSYVECQTCHNRNVRPDPFLNLCLPVKGVSSLEEALKATMSPEVLEGSNAYRCSGVCNSKQTALKGAVFQSFPRTFSIQLLRFEMDYNLMQRIKTTSTFSFPPRINLHQYLEPGKAQNDTPKDDCEYELFSVLIHAGAAAAGHYYAYILDTVSGRFVKYNDANVDWLNDEEYKAIFGEMSAAQKEEAAKVGATAPAAAASSSAACADAHPASKNDADIAASLASPDAIDSDDEDEAVRAARRLALAKRAVPFVDPKRHAYILMYRRVTKGKEEAKESESTGSSSMSEATFQSLLADRAPELESENAEFVRRFAEAKAAANRVLIEINYNPLASLGAAGVDNANETAKEEKSEEAGAAAKAAAEDDEHAAGMHAALRVTKLEVERDITLGELLATVHKQLGLASSGIELSNARLRGWDGLRHVGEQPFVESELSRTLKQLRWRVRKALLLETRAEGQAFPLYKPRQLGLELIELDALSDQYKPSRHFEVDHDAVLSELREKVANMMSAPAAADGSVASASSSISPARVKLILSSCGLAVELVEQSKSLTALRVVKGDTIYAELLPLSADGIEIHFDTVGSKSRVLDKFDSRANLVEIQFNNPLIAATPETISSLGLKGPPPSWSSHKIEIDSRSSLLALKQAISDALCGLSLDAFRLRTNHAGPELKDVSKVLSFFGLNGLIFTELGQPLKANQFVIRCLRWAPEKIKTHAPTAAAEEDKQQQGSSSVPVAPPGPPAAPSAPPMAPSMAPPAAPPMAPAAPPMAPPGPPGPPGPPRAPGLSAPPPPISSSPSPPPSATPLLASSALVLGPSDPFELLGDLVMEDAWSLDQVKSAILTAFPSSGLPSDPSLIRVREKLASKLTKVFHSDKSLKANAAAGTLKDFKVLVAQAVERPEDANISSKHFLLQVVQWRPQQKILAPAREMVLHMDLKLEELQARLAHTYNEEHASEFEALKEEPSVSGDGAEVAAAAAASSSSSAASCCPSGPLSPSSIGFEKPLPYQLLDPVAMSALKFNVDWLTDTSTLSNSSVIRVRDGDTLVWVDQRANRVDQYNAWRESDDIVHGEKRGEREKQRELKIYSPDEQLAMEAAIQAVQAFEKQQQQQAQLAQKPA